MEWLATPCTFPPDSGPWTVAIGSFDGLHLGHQALLQRALAPPYSKGRLLLLSFHPHPRNLLSPQSVPLITPLPHRTALAKERGVHTIWAYPFSQETAQLSPSAFLDTALGSLSLTGLCVGWNFAFGNERLGNTDLLASWCASRLIPFLSFPPIKEGTQVITSSRIRRHLAQGDLKIVHRLLGRHFAIRGKVEKGAGRGKELGFPTINISLDPQQALPPSGVYKGRVLGSNLDALAGINLGKSPTFGGRKMRLEAHLLDWEGDLLNDPVEVRFDTYLREEVEYPTIEELRRQLERDLQAVRGNGG